MECRRKSIPGLATASGQWFTLPSIRESGLRSPVVHGSVRPRETAGTWIPSPHSWAISLHMRVRNAAYRGPDSLADMMSPSTEPIKGKAQKNEHGAMGPRRRFQQDEPRLEVHFCTDVSLGPSYIYLLCGQTLFSPPFLSFLPSLPSSLDTWWLLRDTILHDTSAIGIESMGAADMLKLLLSRWRLILKILILRAIDMSSGSGKQDLKTEMMAALIRSIPTFDTPVSAREKKWARTPVSKVQRGSPRSFCPSRTRMTFNRPFSRPLTT